MARQGQTSRTSAAAPAEARGGATAYDRRHVELLQAAAALFAEHGYHNATIRDLARATSRSLSGLYYYFASKEELLFQIQHHCYTTLLESADRVLAGRSDPLQRLVGFISQHITYFGRNMNEMKVLAHEDRTLAGEMGETIIRIKRRYSNLLISVVREFTDASGRRAKTAPSPEMAAFVLFGMMNWLYTWPRRLRQKSAEELAETVAQIFLCGYPGCPASDMKGVRRSIDCSATPFWDGGGE